MLIFVNRFGGVNLMTTFAQIYEKLLRFLPFYEKFGSFENTQNYKSINTK